MKKKTGAVLIILIMLLCMGSIWPLQFVRKDTTYQTESINYISSREQWGVRGQIQQYFIAQESILKQIAFALDFEGDGCDVLFRVEKEDGTVLTEQEIHLTAEEDDRFHDVILNVKLKKGNLYCFSVEMQEGAETGILYTANGESTALGNDELWLDGEYCDGQAVSSYTYGKPLNMINILCLWAVILMLGLPAIFSLLEIKESKLRHKIEELLEKYQYVILAAEILLVTALVIRSCFTQAVDWDEAYTWNLVKNNSFFGIIKAQSIDPHPAFYFLMVKIAAMIFGDKILVYKLVSVAGMLASMLLCATVLRKRWGVKAAIPGILVIGLAPNFIFYNLNVRMYSWMVFWVLAAALLAYELVESEVHRGRNWILFGIVTLAALYTQYFTVVPLFVIYVYLLVHFAKSKEFKRLFLCSLLVVIGYLPQLYLVMIMLQQDSGATDEGLKASLNIFELCKWSFATNIKWSAYLPLAAYVFAVGILLWQRKKTEKNRWRFLALTAVIYPGTWLICWAISQKMNHFWDNRYMIDALLFAWIFVILIYSSRELITWICLCVWLGILCLSSYGITYAKEMETVPYIQEAQQILVQVPENAEVIYNYDTYDMLYRYYLPTAEFLWYEDVDFSQLEGNEIYMISWGGGSFPQDEIDKYHISVEYIDFFRLEEGVGGVALCKVHFEN